MKPAQTLVALIFIVASCGGAEQKTDSGTPSVLSDASSVLSDVRITPKLDTASTGADVLVIADTVPRAETQIVPDAQTTTSDVAASDTLGAETTKSEIDALVLQPDTAVTETNPIDTMPMGIDSEAVVFVKKDASAPDLAPDATVIITPPPVKKDAGTKDTIIALDTQTTTDLVPANTDTQSVPASTLTITLTSSPTTVTVVKGSTASALGVDFTAGASSDIKVPMVRFRLYVDLNDDGVFSTSETDSLGVIRAVGDVVRSVSLWDGPTQVNIDNLPDANGDVVFNSPYAQAWTVPAGTTKNLRAVVAFNWSAPYGNGRNVVMVDLLGTGADNTTANILAADKDDNNVVATSTSWSAVASKLNWTDVGNRPVAAVAVVPVGTLSVQTADDSPISAILTANTTNNVVMRTKFIAGFEGFSVPRLTVVNLNPASSRSVASVDLYDQDSWRFCSGALVNSLLRCADDKGLFTVDPEQTITIRVTLGRIGYDADRAHSGDRVQLAVYIDKTGDYSDDIKAIGFSSGTVLVDANVVDRGSADFGRDSQINVLDDIPEASNGQVYVSGAVFVVRNTQPTVATVAGSKVLINGERTSYSYSVIASGGGDVGLRRFTLMGSSYGVVIEARRLFENGSEIDPALYTIVELPNKTLVIEFKNKIVIPMDTTKTIELRELFTGVHAGDYICHKILDDVEAATVADANFLWSDSSSVEDVWISGWLVKALPTDWQFLMS